jgi:hypothetical protein
VADVLALGERRRPAALLDIEAQCAQGRHFVVQAGRVVLALTPLGEALRALSEA